MAKPGTNRTLEVLTGELNSALMRKTADKIALGGLFAEAKKEVGHGHWLKYLKENFSLSDTTVASYIKIYQGAAKLPNFGNLKIASHLLDKLFVYSPKRGFAPRCAPPFSKRRKRSGSAGSGPMRSSVMTMLAFAFLQHSRLKKARWGKKNQRTAASTKLAGRPSRHRRAHLLECRRSDVRTATNGYVRTSSLNKSAQSSARTGSCSN